MAKFSSYFRDTLTVSFKRKNDFAVERRKLRQGILQPAVVFLSLFEAIIHQDLLFFFPFYCDFRSSAPDRIKSAPNGDGSQPSSEALLFSVRGQRPESFQESLLRRIFGEPLIWVIRKAAPIAIAA